MVKLCLLEFWEFTRLPFSISHDSQIAPFAKIWRLLALVDPVWWLPIRRLWRRCCLHVSSLGGECCPSGPFTTPPPPCWHRWLHTPAKTHLSLQLHNINKTKQQQKTLVCDQECNEKCYRAQPIIIVCFFSQGAGRAVRIISCVRADGASRDRGTVTAEPTVPMAMMNQKTTAVSYPFMNMHKSLLEYAKLAKHPFVNMHNNR